MTEQASTEQCVIPGYRLDDLAAKCASAVAPAFAAAGWEWSRCGGPPNAAQIAIKLRHLMVDVPLGHTCSSGRLRVYRYVDESGGETFDVTLDVGSVRVEGGS